MDFYPPPIESYSLQTIARMQRARFAAPGNVGPRPAAAAKPAAAGARPAAFAGDHHARINAAVGHMRGFQPTRLDPSPSLQIQDHEHEHPHFADLPAHHAADLADAAVLAGTKPAALVAPSFLRTDLGRAVHGRLAAAHAVSSAGPYSIAIGHPDHVRELAADRSSARRTGQLLGYPEEALDYFEQRGRDMRRGILYPHGTERPAGAPGPTTLDRIKGWMARRRAAWGESRRPQQDDQGGQPEGATKLARAMAEALSPALTAVVRLARMRAFHRRRAAARMARQLGLPAMPHLTTQDLEEVVRWWTEPGR